MIRACIFDMDGVLIDTEPVWRRVEQEIFARVGVELTDDQLLETWGMRITDVVDHWYQSRRWDGVRPQAVRKAIVDGVVKHVRKQGIPAPGALEAVETARSEGMRIAIASSSSRKLIDAVVKRLGLTNSVDALLTADDDTNGKPAPDVYLRAAAELGVDPRECLAIEDSPVGVRSAKAAHMACIALLTHSIDPTDLADADLTILSLREFTPALLERVSASAVDIVGRRRE